MRTPRPLLPALALALPVSACLVIGDPVSDDARVTWAGYPDTVVAGETFSFEFAGPVARNTCGQLDTARLEVRDSAIVLSARRRVYPDAWCSDERVSFYEVRALRMERPGRYPVVTADGRELGTMTVRDSGAFSRMATRGEGTLRSGGGCLFFGPGWGSNQRPFALRGAPGGLEELAGTDTVVRVEGDLFGFSLCGGFGSRPSIRVDSAWATDRTGSEWYPPDEEPRGAGR